MQRPPANVKKSKKDDLSKRGKVGETYRSGSFKKARGKGMKTSDLTKKQLKRATTARGKKVSQKAVKRATGNVVDISSTQFEKGKGVTRNGKLFTGTVKLASGKTATYVRGRRVVASKKPTTAGGGVTKAQAAAARRNASGGGGSRTAASKIPTTRVSPSARGEGSGGTSKPKTRAEQLRALAAKKERARRQRLAALRAKNQKGNAMYSQAGTRVSMSSR